MHVQAQQCLEHKRHQRNSSSFTFFIRSVKADKEKVQTDWNTFRTWLQANFSVLFVFVKPIPGKLSYHTGLFLLPWVSCFFSNALSKHLLWQSSNFQSYSSLKSQFICHIYHRLCSSSLVMVKILSTTQEFRNCVFPIIFFLVIYYLILSFWSDLWGYANHVWLAYVSMCLCYRMSPEHIWSTAV